ncbi:MAG TPA: hypothetical protein PK970_04425 [Hyphomicrobiaceae bacterium]|nr:hypothetical protein [Hyphomicrobiaceae bacterium]
MVTAAIRALLVIASLLAAMNSRATAQQPSPEAMSLARRLVAAQQNPSSVASGLAPMANAALDNRTTNRPITAEEKSEIVTSVLKVVAQRMPPPDNQIVVLLAANMTIDEMRTVVDVLEGPVMQRVTSAISSLQSQLGTAGVPPKLTGEAEAAMKEFAAIMQTPAFKSMFEVQKKNIAAFQGASARLLMASTSLINSEVEQELGRRGLKP